MPRNIKARAIMARVIRDPRNSRMDYFIPADDARRLYEQGKLALDLNNTKPGNPVYMETGKWS
jgi:hypothetical protein